MNTSEMIVRYVVGVPAQVLVGLVWVFVLIGLHEGRGLNDSVEGRAVGRTLQMAPFQLAIVVGFTCYFEFFGPNMWVGLAAMALAFVAYAVLVQAARHIWQPRGQFEFVMLYGGAVLTFAGYAMLRTSQDPSFWVSLIGQIIAVAGLMIVIGMIIAFVLAVRRRDRDARLRAATSTT